MGRIEAYQGQWRTLDPDRWGPFLFVETGLPGPRPNFELDRAGKTEKETIVAYGCGVSEPLPGTAGSPIHGLRKA